MMQLVGKKKKDFELGTDQGNGERQKLISEVDFKSLLVP